MASEWTAGERVGAFAARVLEDLYTVVCGERPVSVRASSDGDTLAVQLRLPGPAPFAAPALEADRSLPYDAIPELVRAAARVQAGVELRIDGWSADGELGLVTFSFSVAGEGGQPPRARGMLRLVADERER
jgi:hypothetical protein